MNILYIGAFPPDFLVKRSGGMIDSLYRASEAIIQGLRSQNDVVVKVITSPDIASWPKGPFYIAHEESEDNDLTLVSSLNISLIKQLWTIFTMTREANKIIRHFEGKVIVVIPYIFFRHVCTLRILKILHPNKVIQASVVPDVFFPKNFFAKMINSLTERMATKFDAYILYTKKMAEHLRVKEGTYEVIEGFREIPAREPKPGTVFKTVYAGSLNYHYGIGRLVESMAFIDNPNIQLHLYGIGTAEPMIRDACIKDSRIFYHGRVSKHEVTDAVYSASVLINPRNEFDGEFTEYSFPSKDIEYMATGIPTLLCRLPGMPVDYYGHFIDIGEGTPKQIASAVERVAAMSSEERKSIGDDSRKFIMDRMDCCKQGKRIVLLFERIINHKAVPC